MTTSRRGLFGLLAGAAALPFVPGVAKAAWATGGTTARESTVRAGVITSVHLYAEGRTITIVPDKPIALLAGQHLGINKRDGQWVVSVMGDAT